LKIRHGAIVDNIVTNLFAQFNDDRFWNEKALVHLKIWQQQPQEEQEQRS